MKSIRSAACPGCKSHLDSQKASFQHKTIAKGSLLFIAPSSSYHILFLLSGQLAVNGDDVDYYRCGAGEMIHLLANSRYILAALERVDMVIYRYTGTEQSCDRVDLNWVKHSYRSTPYLFHSLEMREAMKKFIDSVVYYSDSSIRCAHLHKAKTIELFILFRHYYSKEETYRFFQPSFRKDISFHNLVMANYSSVRSVNELADKCGYSLSNFKKLFAKNFQLSPHQWIRQQQANSIQIMLRDNSISIKTIIEQFNFTDQSHFNTYCKKHYGATAAQVRKAAVPSLGKK